MSLAYHLLLSWFIWCPDSTTPPPPATGGQGSPFSLALSFWHVPSSFEHTLTCLHIKMLQQPWNQLVPQENRSIKWRMVFGHQILPVNALIASGTALLSNICSKQSREYLLCVLRVILISLFIYLKTTCLYSHVQFWFNTTGHILTLPLVYLQLPSLMVKSEFLCSIQENT